MEPPMTSASPGRSRIPGSAPRPDDHIIVLFGATGDLAKRKLLPGLFHLAVAGLLPQRYRIVGTSPPPGVASDDEFKKTKPTGKAWRDFEENLSFAVASPDDPSPLVAAVQAAEKQVGANPQRL